MDAMYVYVYTYTRTYIRVHIYTHIHTYVCIPLKDVSYVKPGSLSNFEKRKKQYDTTSHTSSD
jgi:hypothetical protein